MLVLFKATGAALIASGGFLIGNKIKQQYRKRSEYLKITQDCLKYADNAIAIENMLIEDVLRKCSEKFFSEEKGSDIWNIAADNIQTNYGSFESVWEKVSIDYFENAPFLTKKDQECIKDIGNALGIVSTQRQSINVQAVLKNLNELEQEAKKAEEKEGKHVIQITLAMAAALIILLL